MKATLDPVPDAIKIKDDFSTFRIREFYRRMAPVCLTKAEASEEDLYQEVL